MNNKAYFAFKYKDNTYIKFWLMRYERLLKIFDSYHISYEEYPSERAFIQNIGDKKFVPDYEFKYNDKIYLIVSKDKSMFTTFNFMSECIDALCDYYGIEYYKFNSLEDKEYKEKILELSKVGKGDC